MPAVIDIPEVVERAGHDLHEEQPKAHAFHSGFWRTVVGHMRRQRIRRRQSTSSSSHVSLHPIEMPMERLARENLMLYLRGFTGL
jgi:hypothetical protein